MRLLCNLDTSSTDCRRPWRAEPYGASSVVIVVPPALATNGTVAELTEYLAGRADIFGDTRANCSLNLVVDSFTIPSTEPVSKVLRESDHVSLRVREDVLPASLDAVIPPDYRMHMAHLAKQVDEQTKCAAEFAALAEARGQHVKVLEKQVAELAQQLSLAKTVCSSVPLAAVPEIKCPPTTQSNAAQADSVGSPSAKKSLTGRWQPLPSPGSLHVGDTVRYRVLLADAWQRRQYPSGRRSARVTKIVSEAVDPLVVLQHEDGALDCVEASRLLELHVYEPAH